MNGLNNGLDDFLEQYRKQQGQQSQPAQQTQQSGLNNGLDDFLTSYRAQQTQPAQQPAATGSGGLDPIAAPLQQTQKKAQAEVQRQTGGLATPQPAATLEQKRAEQAAADKRYRGAVWDFLNTMISNGAAGQAGVVAAPMDAGESYSGLTEAKERAAKAAAAFDKQSFGERQGHELSGWGQRTLGNIGNTLATIGTQYNKSRAMQIANDPAAAITAAATGEDQQERAKRIESELISEETKAGRNAAQETFDRYAERGAEELQKAKDGASPLGRLGLDIETGALDLGADALTNAVAPGSGMAMMGARVFGEAAREERQKGGDLNKQMLAGTKAAAIEVLTEKISGPFEKVYGKTITGKAINKAIDAIDSRSGRIAINLLTDALGEGAEEVLSDLLNPVADRALGLADSWDEAWSDTTLEGVLYDGLLGTLLGAAGSVGKIMQTKGTITQADAQQIKADAQEAGENALQQSLQQTAQENAAQQQITPVTEATAQSAENAREGAGDISAPPSTQNANTGDSERLNRATVSEGTENVAGQEKTAPEGAEIEPVADEFLQPDTAPGTVTEPAPVRTPAGDFTPKKETRWNPKSERGKAEMKAARQLRRESGLWDDSTAAAQAVHRVAESMRDRRRGTGVMEVARKAADEMMQSQKSGIESGDRDLYNKLREYLRGQKIQISDELRGDITDYNEWRKSVFGKLRLAKAGLPIDSVYAELSQVIGEGFFPPDITAHSDQIARILHVLDAAKPQAIMMSEAFSGQDYTAIRDAIAGDLAKAAAQTVGGQWVNYEPGSTMGYKSEAAKRYDAIQQEIDVASWDGQQLSQEEAARAVDERYMQYGVYDLSELLNETESEGEESEYGTNDEGEEAAALPRDDEAETEWPADAGDSENVGAGIQSLAERDLPAGRQTGDLTAPPAATGGEVTAAGDGERVERGFSENVRTDENMEQPIRDSFTEDPEYYNRLTNKATLKKAQTKFAEGIDSARDAVEGALADAKAGKKLSPEMVPLARMVANELTRGGDTESARRILSDLAVELTQAGQLGQAAKILRGMDPQAAVKTVQKALDKINEQYKKRWGSRGNWKAELTESERSMLESIDMTDEAAFEDAYRQVAKRVGAEMPATVWEKLTELRRVNMLLRPRTQLKNVFANVPMVGLRKGAETLSAAIQDSLAKNGKLDKAGQTRSLSGMTPETKQLAKDYFAENKETILREGDKWDMNSVFREHRTFFKDGAITKALSNAASAVASKASGKDVNVEMHNVIESARRLTYDLLEKGDAPFVRSAFVDSLAQYCAAQGITSAEGITPEAVQFAMANAMEATFKNANIIASFINQVKQKGGAAGAAVDILFPFTTTPLNITDLMLKYSPVGFVTTAFNSKNMSLVERIDANAKATVGTLVFGLGILLRGLGAITGKQDDDKDKAAYDKARGISPYSIGGKWSYDWAQPFGSLLALGAEVYDAAEGNESWKDALLNAMYSAGDSVLNMSLFQNITKIMHGYGSNTQALAEAIVEGGATQFVPGLAGDIAKIIDGTVRSTYTGGNAVENALVKAGVNVPGLSKLLPASVNVRGEKQTRGNLGARAGDTLLNPGITNHNKPHKMDKYIDELYGSTGDKTIFPSVSPYKIDYGGTTYRMTGKEREQFQTTQGQTYYTLLEDLVDEGVWGDLSDREKVRVLADVRSYALDEAKRELVEGRGNEYESNDWEKVSALAKEKPDALAMYLGIKVAANQSIKNKSFDTLDKILRDAGVYGKLPDTAKEMLDASTTTAHLDDMAAAAKIGVKSEKWTAVYEEKRRLDDTKGTSTQKATQFAAFLDRDKSLNEKQKELLQQQMGFYAQIRAEADNYKKLTGAGMDTDTAEKVTATISGLSPLPGKTQVSQDQKVDAILSSGWDEAAQWRALKVYTSEAFYDKAAEAYRRGIDLDDYVRQTREAETNGKSGLSQDELWDFYKKDSANETYVKVMWMINGWKTDWDTYKRTHR